jgi:hypothetical protein
VGNIDLGRREIMSKTNDTSNIATLEARDPLADSELDAASGGIWFLGYSSNTDRVVHGDLQCVKFLDKAS